MYSYFAERIVFYSTCREWPSALQDGSQTAARKRCFWFFTHEKCHFHANKIHLCITIFMAKNQVVPCPSSMFHHIFHGRFRSCVQANSQNHWNFQGHLKPTSRFEILTETIHAWNRENAMDRRKATIPVCQEKKTTKSWQNHRGKKKLTKPSWCRISENSKKKTKMFENGGFQK